MSFLLVQNKSNETIETKEEKVINKTRYEANYYAEADESSPAAGQSSSYKGGAVFLEPNANFVSSFNEANGGNILAISPFSPL